MVRVAHSGPFSDTIVSIAPKMFRNHNSFCQRFSLQYIKSLDLPIYVQRDQSRIFDTESLYVHKTEYLIYVSVSVM